MAQSFAVLAPWDDRGWKLKIRDRERIEPPHVSVLWKTEAWRFGLREKEFLDRQPDPRRVPDEIVGHLHQNIRVYVDAWNMTYPDNPV